MHTLFPPIPKTVWRPGDPEVECLLGKIRNHVLHVDQVAGLAMRVMHLPLDRGLYGVEFQLSLDDADLAPDQQIALVQVTVSNGDRVLSEKPIVARQLAVEFGGMYQGLRLDLIVDEPFDDVEFRISSAGLSSFQVHGMKLVPRPGRIWFARELWFEQQTTTIHPDRSATCLKPGLIGTPPVLLPPGEYRLGVKLIPPEGITSGTIAAIEVKGRIFGSDPDTALESIVVNPVVTAESTLANFGIPDTKLRFRLAQPYQQVTVELKALMPGLTVQWVRLATADEAVWHHYFNLGGTSSVLGHPASGFVALGTSPRGLQGSCRWFWHGRIYWTVEHGPCEVFGEIEEQYQARGGHFKELGFPISRPKYSHGKVTQHFEGGTLESPD